VCRRCVVLVGNDIRKPNILKSFIIFIHHYVARRYFLDFHFKLLKVYRLLFILLYSTFKISTMCPNSVLMCLVFVSEHTASVYITDISGSNFITEMKSAYCAVRTGPLNNRDYVMSLNGSY